MSVAKPSIWSLCVDVPVGLRRTPLDDGVLVDNLVQLRPPQLAREQGVASSPKHTGGDLTGRHHPLLTRRDSVRLRLECQTNFSSFVRSGERDVVPPVMVNTDFGRLRPARQDEPSGTTGCRAGRSLAEASDEASAEIAYSLLVEPRPDEHEFLPAVAERRAPVGADSGQRLRLGRPVAARHRRPPSADRPDVRQRPGEAVLEDESGRSPPRTSPWRE